MPLMMSFLISCGITQFHGQLTRTADIGLPHTEKEFSPFRLGFRHMVFPLMAGVTRLYRNIDYLYIFIAYYIFIDVRLSTRAARATTSIDILVTYFSIIRATIRLPCHELRLFLCFIASRALSRAAHGSITGYHFAGSLPAPAARTPKITGPFSAKRSRSWRQEESRLDCTIKQITSRVGSKASPHDAQL